MRGNKYKSFKVITLLKKPCHLRKVAYYRPFLSEHQSNNQMKKLLTSAFCHSTGYLGLMRFCLFVSKKASNNAVTSLNSIVLIDQNNECSQVLRWNNIVWNFCLGKQTSDVMIFRHPFVKQPAIISIAELMTSNQWYFQGAIFQMAALHKMRLAIQTAKGL